MRTLPDIARGDRSPYRTRSTSRYAVILRIILAPNLAPCLDSLIAGFKDYPDRLNSSCD